MHASNLATREARIIIPTDAMPVESRILFERDIVRMFGGFTYFNGVGSWTPPEGGAPVREAVTIYDIAVIADETSSGKLRELAQNAAMWFGQREVYLRMPDGRVLFIAQPAPVKNDGVVVPLAGAPTPAVGVGAAKVKPRQLWRTHDGSVVATGDSAAPAGAIAIRGVEGTLGRVAIAFVNARDGRRLKNYQSAMPDSLDLVELICDF